MADEEKIIDVKFRYTTEGAEQVAATAQKTRQQAADEFINSFGKQAKQQTAETQAFVQTYNAGTQQMTNNTKAFQKSMSDLYGEMRGVRYAAMGLQQLGTLFTLGGGLLTAGLIADANNYVKTVGAINEGNDKWLNAENEIKQANLEIGQSTRDVILPGLQMGADLMDRLAAIVKDNPWIIQAALGVGSTMLILGVAATLIARLVTVVADLGLAIGRIGMTQAGAPIVSAFTGGGEEGAAMGAGATAAVAGAVGIAIVALVAGGYELMNVFTQVTEKLGATKDEAMALGDVVAQVFGIATPWLSVGQALNQVINQFPGFVSQIQSFVSQIQSLLKVLGITVPGIPQAATISNQPTQAEVQAFINYQKQINDAQEQYSQQRKDIIDQSEQQIVNSTNTYEMQRQNMIDSAGQQAARSARDFAEQQAMAERNFNESQDKALRNYNEQVTRSERDFRTSQRTALVQHHQDMARLEAEHNLKIFDLVAQRDALGIVKENQRYNLEVSQKDQSFTLSQSQTIRQHEQQRADQAAAFRQSRADAIAAYDQQRADALAAHNQQVSDAAQNLAVQLARLDAAHKLEMAKLDQTEKDKLAKLDSAYKKQVDQIQTAFIDRLRALDPYILGDYNAYHKYLESESQQFQSWLKNFESSAQAATQRNTGMIGGVGTIGTIGAHQMGGYASFFGPGETGSPEFVLNNATTRAMEAAVGGKLSQASMLAAVLMGRNAIAGGQGGHSLQVTVVGRSMSMSEIKHMVDNTLDQRLGDLIPAFGGG